jgi:hypothetical protein
MKRLNKITQVNYHIIINLNYLIYIFNALLKEKKTGKIKKISFGDKRYQQYEDKVLKKYSHLNHYDKKRRDLYRSRHKNDKLNEFSSGHFSYYYL